MRKRGYFIIAAVAIGFVVLVCSVMPKKAAWILDVPKQVTSLRAEVISGLDSPVNYETQSESEKEVIRGILQDLKLRSIGKKDVWGAKSLETARITLTLHNDQEISFSFAVTGEVCYNDRNYLAVNAAPLEKLMSQIKGWEEVN